MSHQLPAHANLEHLKKQAKDRLHDVQERNPGAKLADAQHAIAREYGFASWPKLKTHVESLAPAADPVQAPAVGLSHDGNVGGRGGTATNVIDDSPPNYGFARYTPKARQALFFSHREASQLGSASIEPEHLLLGLIRTAQGVTNWLFERAHLSLEDARAGVAAHTVAREKLPFSVEIPFGPGTTQVLRYTAEEAYRLQHHHIGIAHLVLGILRDEQSTATSVLRGKGIGLHSVRDDIAQLLNEEPT
jgi:hypothetical protein